MKKQLLLCKRLHIEACAFAERVDPVSSGLAISLFQDSVEMFVWILIKERSIPVKDGASFTSNIDTIQKSGLNLSHTPKLIELNKARVGFKHYGNLPAPDEAGKFRAYVEDFLRTSFTDHFGENFDELSLVDLVKFKDVRERLKSAEAFVASGSYKEAVSETAIAKTLLFSLLARFVPKLDHNLRDMDSILQRIPEFRGVKPFHYLTQYLESLRETALVSLLRLPLQDYSFLRKQLPTATQYGDGRWETYSPGLKSYNEDLCRRAITCLVNLSLRMETLI